jgi:hypothetical protein
MIYDLNKNIDQNICSVLNQCGFPKREIAQKHDSFTLRHMKSQRDLRDVEDQRRKVDIYIHEGCRLELVEYYESCQEANAFRMSFGDCSDNMSMISE